MHDYSDFESDISLGGNSLKVLEDLVQQKLLFEEKLEKLEAQVDSLKTNLKRINETDIPNFLEDFGGSVFLPDGREIRVDEKIRTSFMPDRKQDAIKWLTEKGHGNIVKRKVEVFFSKTQQEEADKFIQELRDHETPLNFQQDDQVHWQTLGAFSRGQLKKGEELPSDLFNVYRQKFTSVKSSK